MQRTLQTTQQSLSWLMARGVPAIALAELQETTVNQCDVGSPLSSLQHTWPQFDWSHMDPVYPAKEGLYAFSEEALLRRGVAARRWLRNRPEKVIAVVSHAGFLRVGMCHRKFENADYRIFDFRKDGDGEEEFELVESELTAAKGGGMGRSRDGYFGWEENDFKWMPGRSDPEKEDVDKSPM